MPRLDAIADNEVCDGIIFAFLQLCLFAYIIGSHLLFDKPLRLRVLMELQNLLLHW